MAAKGGNNGGASTTTMTWEAFFYLVGDEMLLTDLGAGEYTKEYFHEGRYRILCNNSLWTQRSGWIDGKGQKEGGEYSCSRFEADGRGETIISFAGAYGND